MTITTGQGLDRVRELYRDRTLRARELKSEGKTLLGYFDMYPVLEMVTALDLVPFQILGDITEPVTLADSYLPNMVCPFLRSFLDLGLKGRYSFLDGITLAHSCEVGEKMSHIWNIYLNPRYSHFLDTPHTTHAAAQKEFKELLQDFRKTLEAFTGLDLSPERLRRAIELHNEERRLVRELYDLRKPDPPLVSGSETIQVLAAITSLPVAEANELLRQVIAEARQRRDGPPPKSARLLLWGSIIDNTALTDMIESLDASVVMDDENMGSRSFFPMVEATPDPLDGLAHRYLVGLKTPRIFPTPPVRDGKKDYAGDLENRFGYLKEYARDWQVNGVVMQVLRYCDVQAYEVPSLRDYLDSLDIPNLFIEHDYSQAAMAPLKTRVQAFLEIIA
ncbi:MAG: 2-hydroxyacyl-CoA dehydratase [Chloroflexi bacterium]|nr:2-hydroxyacyl-CoA dehydratase [Chloroflexota bacterium]